MEAIVERLTELFDKEENATSEARTLRQQQLDLCEKELLGRCFRLRATKSPIYNKEEYWKYMYFTRIVPTGERDKWFYLIMSTVSFGEIESAQEMGVWIREESEPPEQTIRDWLYDEDTEETTLDDFRAAQQRAFQYICDAMDKH